MAGKAGREAEFAMFPKFKAAYIRAFSRMMEERERRGKTANGMRWGNGVDVFHWWMEDGVLPGQLEIDDLDFDDDI